VDYLRQLGESLRAPPQIQDIRSLSRWWQEQTLSRSRHLYRSPLYSQLKPLPGRRQAHYTYERSLWPSPLEQVDNPPDWQAESLICRNRAAACWTALVTLRDMLGRALKVRTWGLHPSLQALVEAMESSRWQVSEASGPFRWPSPPAIME